MMNTAIQLEHILFDPLSYLHPERQITATIALESPGQRAALNNWLLYALNFSTDLALPTKAEQPETLQLITHWKHWPDICTLTGTQLLKSALSLQGRYLKLPARLRTFMQMPLRKTKTPPANTTQALTSGDVLTDLQKVGLIHLLAWQHPVPEALHQRLPLMFTPALNEVFASPSSTLGITPDKFLLTQAIQYAKSHPHRS